ncbi:PDZ and LIM domain protein Zasp isoform X1 [Anopheles nili]|uniref:PDZ and LIM domain protein Zasp isoform X1 n=1 Tax=Anopheles nili TaxID=185578 RepID=UPI00237A65D8|nr:PDZ and LIM domain protein Zasp isoform X1 [Anopheles nili]
MANLMTVRLQRGEGQAWGFRLQGGKDFSAPLVLQRVNGGSVADQAGLMAGDALIKVNATEVFNMRHKEAQDVIVAAGNTFELTVSRGGATWKPSVTPTGSLPSPSPSLPGNITPVTRTSLAATPQEMKPIGSGHNTAAKPFAAELNGNDGQIKSIVNNQYNTPVGMYSDETIAETLSSQAEVLAGGVLGVNFKKNERVYSPANSEVYKMLHEQGDDPEPAQQQQQQQQYQQQQPQSPLQAPHHLSNSGSGTNTVTRHVMAPVDRPVAPASNGLPPGQNICASCERLIVGVFVRIKDKNLHADCFKCATCGTSLKNQGYFNLNDKLYCDIHARLAALNSPPPGMNGMVPVTVTKPGHKTGVQAISAALNAHANLNGRSQSPYGNPGALGPSQSPSHSRSSSTTSSSGYCNSSSLSPVQSNKVSPLHSRTSSENELIDRSHSSNSSTSSNSAFELSGTSFPSPPSPLPPPPPPLAMEESTFRSEMAAGSEPPPPPAPAPAPAPAVFGANGLAAPVDESAISEPDGATEANGTVTQNEFGFYYQTYGGRVIRSVLPPGKNASYKVNQNNITPKPFGAPLPMSPLAQVQPPASYPPVAGSVPTPFSAALVGAAAPAPAPAPVSVPAPTLAPAPTAAPAMAPLAPASVPAPQGPNMFNKGRAACSTSAPNRGRGVMNKAVGPGGRVPLCGCCQQQIRGPFITALGRIWCPDHFICHNANCKRPLADIGFVEEKGDLYCEYCFEEFLAPPCSKCNARVKGDCLNAIGKQFHPECFKCTYCGKQFGNSPFFLEEGDPYCEKDWNDLFTTKCFACGFPVEAGDKWVEALNNNYHSQCFNCTSCKKNLEGQSFFAKGGRPFCKNHAR